MIVQIVLRRNKCENSTRTVNLHSKHFVTLYERHLALECEYDLLFSTVSVSVKVLPVTPLLSGVFVHRVFCPYFVSFEGVGVMRRFLWCTQENIDLTCNGVESHCNAIGVLVHL